MPIPPEASSMQCRHGTCSHPSTPQPLAGRCAWCRNRCCCCRASSCARCEPPWSRAGPPCCRRRATPATEPNTTSISTGLSAGGPLMKKKGDFVVSTASWWVQNIASPSCKWKPMARFGLGSIARQREKLTCTQTEQSTRWCWWDQDYIQHMVLMRCRTGCRVYRDVSTK